ncbi:MAG: hypothetical protein HW403_400 [Dehalococcoidia bacterium]|nr:hypothetical protein [Dehalococcoidia bacterium]
MTQREAPSITACADCEAQLYPDHQDEKLRVYHCEGCSIPLCQRCFDKVGFCLKCEGC